MQVNVFDSTGTEYSLGFMHLRLPQKCSSGKEAKEIERQVSHMLRNGITVQTKQNMLKGVSPVVAICLLRKKDPATNSWVLVDFGMAVCSKNENYSRATGRKLSSRRLTSNTISASTLRQLQNRHSLIEKQLAAQKELHRISKKIVQYMGTSETDTTEAVQTELAVSV